MTGPTTLEATGERLIDHGYRIVPIQPGGKWPVDSGWSSLNADPDALAKWIADGRANWGVGILAEDTPGIDIDVKDSAVVDRLLAWCRDNGLAAGQRVGNAPKVLLPCYAPVPFRKTASRAYQSPDGERHKIEILGKGQQWVAYHIHPDTGRPYTWKGAEPLDTPAEILPTLSAAKAREFVAFFESIVPADWKPISAPSEATGSDRKSHAKLTAPVAKAAAALRSIPNDYDRDGWIRIGHAVKAATAGDPEAGRDLWHKWSETWDGYDANHTDAAWDGFKDVKSIGAGTLFHEARERGGWTWQPRASDEFEAVDLGPEDEAVSQLVRAKVRDIKWREGLPLVKASGFAGKPVPTREWHVDGFVPASNVTLLSGDGATGKSLLALMLAAATVAGRPWLARPVRQGPVIYFSAEDDAREVHRRLADIEAHFNGRLAALEGLDILDFTGEDDPVLGKPDATRATIEPTELFGRIKRYAVKVQPRLIVFDTLADIFGGDEISRAHARRFVGLLRGLAIETSAAVLVLSHPSLAGMASGAGTSGSTGWNNSVRSRLYFERVTEKADGQRVVEADPDRRVLRKKKANYGRAGEDVELRYKNGVFVLGSATDAETKAAEARVERKFLYLVKVYTVEGRNVSANAGSTYAPALFAKDPRGERISKSAFAEAMNRLFDQGSLATESEGPPSRRRSKLVIAGDPPPDYEAPNIED